MLLTLSLHESDGAFDPNSHPTVTPYPGRQDPTYPDWDYWLDVARHLTVVLSTANLDRLLTSAMTSRETVTGLPLPIDTMDDATIDRLIYLLEAERTDRAAVTYVTGEYAPENTQGPRTLADVFKAAADSFKDES